MDFVLSFEWLIIGIIAVTALITTPKIVQNMTLSSTKSQKKLQQLDNEYIEELEHQLKKSKMQFNNAQKGPQVQGELSELGELLPEVLENFQGMAPNWLKPFLKNKDMQGWIMKYVQENPEKAGEMFGKIVKKTVNKTKGEDTQVAAL